MSTPARACARPPLAPIFPPVCTPEHWPTWGLPRAPAHVHPYVTKYTEMRVYTRKGFSLPGTPPKPPGVPALASPSPRPRKSLPTGPPANTAAQMFPELLQSEKNHLNSWKSPRSGTRETAIWSLKVTQPGPQKRPPLPAKSGRFPSLLWPRSGAGAEDAQCARLRASTAAGGTRHDPTASSWTPPFCEHPVVPACRRGIPSPRAKPGQPILRSTRCP